MARPLPYARAAVRHLKATDPVLARVIRRVGPFTLKPAARQDVFEALLEAIVYQQLHGKAAATIHGRVLALFPDKKITPESFLAISTERLRACGLSGNKLLSIQDLARKTAAGLLFDRRRAARMTDEAIIESLTQVRGIGPWTAHMFLIFRLGRPDVLPTGDFGVRKAFGLLYKNGRHPTPEMLEKHGRRWAPYRTVASWYLWRFLDA